MKAGTSSSYLAGWRVKNSTVYSEKLWRGSEYRCSCTRHSGCLYIQYLLWWKNKNEKWIPFRWWCPETGNGYFCFITILLVFQNKINIYLTFIVLAFACDCRGLTLTTHRNATTNNNTYLLTNIFAALATVDCDVYGLA